MMPFTSHGHPVPGLPQEERPADQVRARCGGPGLCVQCSVEAGNTLRAHIGAKVKDNLMAQEDSLFLNGNEEDPNGK